LIDDPIVRDRMANHGDTLAVRLSSNVPGRFGGVPMCQAPGREGRIGFSGNPTCFQLNKFLDNNLDIRSFFEC